MTKIIAHRGARSIAPENTIVAAEIARCIGADLWETDVHVTKDGKLILFHDDDLLRTTNARDIFPKHNSFQVNDFNLEQIQMLDLGAAFIQKDPFGEICAGNIAKKSLESFKGERVPSLEEALSYTQQKQWPVNLELKEQTGKLKAYPLPKSVVDLVRIMKINPELIIISSFNHNWLKEIQILSPEIETQALVGDYPGYEMTWSDYCFDTYNVDADILSIEVIERLHKMGKRVNVFTVNEKDDMVRYINAGVDGIFTDYPQVMKKI
ncbi:MAG: glycerophosphodiester phosphodiesterase [Desulfamplus sp.]|nr:glycerophosphodiester phosphodiesterase [Desulfamplus sp.]